MKHVKILDCTLRDGGYINQWQFGSENIQSIISGLVKANVDLVECGFLSNAEKSFPDDESRFTTVSEIDRYIPRERGNSKFVAMVNLGEFDFGLLEQRTENSIDGIRVAFHKQDLTQALEAFRIIMEKGYMAYVQPMVSLSYQDDEFLELIHSVNGISPYAFYIVDSHGSMKNEDVLRYYYLAENNLAPAISLGFHSHNNLQMSFSNAQILIEKHTSREIIIDSCVFGMGRGAGNLNTELITEYINREHGGHYLIKPILQTADSTIEPIYRQYYWGFSLPYYLSANYRCHPNYAGFLRDLNTLTFEDMDNIFSQIEAGQRDNFNKEYIEELYERYQDCRITDTDARESLREKLNGKTVVIVAPGKNAVAEANKVRRSISENNAIVIAVNHVSEIATPDYVFVSNQRRYDKLKDKSIDGLIITSNIRDAANADYVLNHFDLTNSTEAVRDNVTLMLIELLIQLGTNKVLLAGVDGFVGNARNFAISGMETFNSEESSHAKNLGTAKMIQKYSREIKLEFITSSIIPNYFEG